MGNLSLLTLELFVAVEEEVIFDVVVVDGIVSCWLFLFLGLFFVALMELLMEGLSVDVADELVSIIVGTASELDRVAVDVAIFGEKLLFFVSLKVLATLMLSTKFFNLTGSASLIKIVVL
jgi:hypothetical protein